MQFPSVDHLLAFKERSLHDDTCRSDSGGRRSPNMIAAARSAAGEDARRLGAAVGRASRRIDPAMNQPSDGPRRRTKKRERRASECRNTATDVHGRDRRRSNDSPSVTSEPYHPFSGVYDVHSGQPLILLRGILGPTLPGNRVCLWLAVLISTSVWTPPR
jgi:hypothetical protein